MAIPVNLETKAEYLFRVVGRDEWAVFVVFYSMFRILFSIVPRGGGGLLPYKGVIMIPSSWGVFVYMPVTSIDTKIVFCDT